MHATIVENPVTLGSIVDSAPRKSEGAESKDHVGWSGVMMRWGQQLMCPIQKWSPFNSFLLLHLRGCVGNTSSVWCIWICLSQVPIFKVYHHQPFSNILGLPQPILATTRAGLNRRLWMRWAKIRCVQTTSAANTSHCSHTGSDVIHAHQQGPISSWLIPILYLIIQLILTRFTPTKKPWLIQSTWSNSHKEEQHKAASRAQ